MPLHDLLRQGTHAFAGSLNSHRILLYALVSTIALSAVILNALKNHSNFYSVAIYLSKSNRSVLVLANFGFLLALLCGHVVQRIFFGTLRPNEVERLYDRLWFFITESLLAFTIFRDEFDIPFALMFGFLLFVKSFHWLAGDRIEWMDQRPYPGPSPLFHFRMSALFFILWATDFFMFLIAVENTIANGVGGMVLFASEYGILMASVLNTISKYLLSAYELRRARQRGGGNAPPWENKSMWIFYIELATDFLKLTTYLVFFAIIITFYGLPLNIVRDVYITARSFVSRLRALHRYQTATRNMDQRYPNATADEMTAMSDRTCIICRDEMVLHEAAEVPVNADGPNTTPKKLPCGHVFHFHCLRSWLERQQSCPTCRRTVLESPSQGPVPGRPAPGPADPQQQNMGAQNQNQNQPVIRNPLGNPLGLMGRLFGPPAQPPVPQGQVPLPHQHNAVQNPGILAGQVPQGVVIQYHIQYQIPRNLQPHQHPPELQPVPPFPGFPGPDGVWQHWPGPAVNQNVPPEPLGGNNTRPTVPVPPPSTSEQTSSTSASTPAQFAESSSNSNNEDSSRTNPSEAAALAALRRLNNNGSSRASSSRDAGSVAPQDTTTLPSRLANPSLGDHAASNSSPDQSVDVPSLIPLYDYGLPGHSNQATSTTSRSGVTQPTSPRSTEIHQHVSSDTPPTRPGPRATQQPMPGPSGSHYERARSSDLQIPIPNLPPTLTDEQLAIMDRVTREAIDERLRVLEGVSGAVYRCIDDLMRMRSALPSSTQTPSSHHSSPTIPESRVSSLNEQIKDLTTDHPSRLTTLPTSSFRGSDNGQSSQPAKDEESGPSTALSTQHEEET